MNKVYSFLGGRTTAFTLAYFACATVGFFLGKMSGTDYAIGFGASLFTMLGKSVSDNYHERKRAGAGNGAGSEAGGQDVPPAGV